MKRLLSMVSVVLLLSMLLATMVGADTSTGSPKITAQPKGVSVTAGTTVQFSITATGTSPLSYQWQSRKDSASSWANSGQSGAKTRTLAVSATAGLHGWQFRCVVTDGNKKTAVSTVAVLTIVPKITVQPKDQSAQVGNIATFTVDATGTGTLSYQWQSRKDASTAWANSGQSGAKTKTLSVTATAGLHGWQFRCVVTDGNGKSWGSGAATLKVSPKFTTQPKSQTVAVGNTATFTAEAIGKTPLNYQWQSRKDANSAWSNSGQTGSKTKKLSVASTAGLNGWQFRCVVTDANGKSWGSGIATLTVVPKITTQPEDIAVVAGTKVMFKIAATGKATLTYQWQSRKDANSAWANSGQTGAKTDSLTVTATAGLNGWQFRGLVKDGNGQTAVSRTVTLTVETLPINAVDVTLYALSPSYADVLTIPAGMAQTFQLKANSSDARYAVTSGSCCTVDSTGLVRVRYVSTTVYNITTGTSTVENRPQFGDGTITCTIGNVSYTINVHVVDYSVAYADELISAYLKDNINSSMTDLEKMQAIARYPATFNYDAHYSGYISMLIYGGGDCWASTALIIRECELLGIDAWSRNGNRDSGAGSGHRNAMAYYNGKYYELEAGYSGTAPRSYHVKERTSLFSYRQRSDGTLSVYQYDGKTCPAKLVIPDSIGGKTVTVIENSAFSGLTYTEIVLPANCTEIGNYAFSACSDLTKITIPATVKTIGNGAFAKATGVQITVASGNPYLTVVNNSIYSKDKTILYAAPAVSGELTLPSTVTTIQPYAFYFNTNVTAIAVPAGVTSIGEGAFGNCSNLKTLTFAGNKLTKLEPFVFAYSGLSSVTLPSSIQTLDAYAFWYSSLSTVTFTSTQAPAWTEEDFDTTRYKTISFFVPKNATGYDTGVWTNLDVATVS